MSSRGSQKSKSDCSRTAYSVYILPQNGVALLSLPKLRITEHVMHRYDSLAAISEDLVSKVDLSLQNSTCNLAGEVLTFGSQGYNNKQVFERALKIPAEVEELSNSVEMLWIRFLFRIWEFFDLESFFTASTGTSWSGYDTAITKVLPDRLLLSKPKPDFAFGLGWPSRSQLSDYAHSWIDLTVPSTNAFCTDTLAFPFFICESASSAGTLRTAENQLCNSLIKSHDILCSLGLQDELHLLGMTQVGAAVNLYASLSTNKVALGGEVVIDTVYLVKLLHCDLDSLSGSLFFLRFIEYAKSYGSDTFCVAVETALRRAFA